MLAFGAVLSSGWPRCGWRGVLLVRSNIALALILVIAGIPRIARPLFARSTENPREQGAQQHPKDAQGDLLPKNAVSRLGTNRLRKNRGTFSVAYCPDGKWIASTDNRGTVRVWNADTGVEAALVYSADYPGRILNHQIRFSSDGQYLIYGAHGRIHRWEVATKRSSALPIRITGAFDLSPDGKLIAGIDNHDLIIWGPKKWTNRFRLHHSEKTLQVVTFSSDGKLIAAADGKSLSETDPTMIRLWDVAVGKQVAGWQARQQSIESLNFSPDGKILVSGGFDSVCLWDVASHRLLASLQVKSGVVSFSPDGKLLAAAGFSNTVQLWDPVKHEKVRSIPTGNGWITALAFSPDGKKLLTGGWHHALHLWDVSTGTEVLPKEGHRFDLHSIHFSPDGTTLASRGGDQLVLLWDIGTGKVRRRFSLADDDLLLERSARWSPTLPSTLAYAPDGKTLAAIAGGDGKTIILWDTVSGRKNLKIHAPRHPFSSIAFSPAGEVLAAADTVVHLWSPSTGDELKPYYLDGESPIVFSPDGRILATGESGPLIHFWDWRRGRSLRDFSILKSRSPSGLAFSFDGQLLACCGGAYRRKNGIVHLLQTTTGNCFQRLDHKKTSVLCVAVSPDGRLLASGGEDDTAVHIWDVLTGKELTQFSGHRGNIYCLAFSPDGKTLASGSADTTILLWDVSTIQVKSPTIKPDPQELQDLWNEMSGGVSTAYPAVGALSTAGDRAVAFLKKQLRPVPTPNAEQLPHWIADLDSEDFHKREAASTQLARLGEDAEAAVRHALQAKPTIEARKRLEQILAGISPLPSGGEELRQVRAVHVLECIGSPAACDLLKKLAAGTPGATLTRNSKLALQRLECRAKQP